MHSIRVFLPRDTHAKQRVSNEISIGLLDRFCPRLAGLPVLRSRAATATDGADHLAVSEQRQAAVSTGRVGGEPVMAS
jgi:hypothetical protein